MFTFWPFPVSVAVIWLQPYNETFSQYLYVMYSFAYYLQQQQTCCSDLLSVMVPILSIPNYKTV